jgi:hypothetical protein
LQFISPADILGEQSLNSAIDLLRQASLRATIESDLTNRSLLFRLNEALSGRAFEPRQQGHTPKPWPSRTMRSIARQQAHARHRSPARDAISADDHRHAGRQRTQTGSMMLTFVITSDDEFVTAGRSRIARPPQ